MPTIPEEVKALYKQNSISKRLRIHFPNGEREDITNENLEGQTFSFTERICSQSSLKFGLCEASVIEFECFGVGDIKGCKIEVYQEIDISSLSEDFQTQYGMESDDVPFPYYQLGFGTFIVDECPRQPDMRHRKVVAYSETYASRFTLCEIEKAKQKLQLAENVPYAFDLQNFIASNIPSVDISSWESVEVSMTSRVNTYTDATGLSGIYSVQATEYTYAIPAEYLDFLYCIDFSTYQEAVEAYGELVKNFPYSSVRKEYLAHIQLQSSEDGIMLPLASGERIYPYMGLSAEYTCFITVTTEAVVTTDEYKEYTYRLLSTPALKRYAGTLTSFELTFPRIEAMNRFKETVYVPNPEIDYSNMLEAWLELNGLFGKNARDGSLQMLSLTEAKQVDLEKSDYIEPWYEEQYSKPYGSVSVTFKDADGNAINAEYGIVDALAEGYEESDYQTYSLSGNYLIESRAFSIEEITVILAAFAEKIANIQYMPAEIELQGQPWIEAGDVINVVTDEDAITTIVLQRELRGIQALRDTFKAEYSEKSGGGSADSGASGSSGSGGGSSSSDVTGVKGNAETVYRTGNVNITPANIGLGNVNNTSDADKPVSTAQQEAIDEAYANSNAYTDKKVADLIGGAPSTLDTLKEVADAMEEHEDVVEALNAAIGSKADANELDSHVKNTSNPHGVTKAQVGLGNVPNVATDDQTPTYTATTTLAALVSGEKLSIAFGKIAKAISDFIAHLADKKNPHGVTKFQVGLGNVDNTADKDKSVKYATNAGTAALATVAEKTVAAQELIDGSGNLMDVGSETTPVWFNGGIPEACNRSLVSVTNNLTATVAGTALDAVQGKKLDDKITAARAEAKEYTDGAIAEEVTARNTMIDGLLVSANNYTKEMVKEEAAARADAVNLVQDDLNDHVDNTTVHITANERSSWNGKRPVRRCYVGQNGTANTSLPWYKFASITLASTYVDKTITFKVSTGYGDTTTAVGILTAHIRVGGSITFNDGQLVWEYAASGINVNDFVMAYLSTSGTDTKVELWVKVTDSYRFYHFEVLSEHTRTTWSTDWSLITTVTIGSAASVTSGYTQIVSTLATLKNSISGNAASATKATQDGNGNVIKDTYATKDELAGYVESDGAVVGMSDIGGILEVDSSNGTHVLYSDKNKPTKADVGLSNVPNVATNNQTPTYSDTTTLATLSSGEKLSVAFPKIKLAITNLISHLKNTSNPHGVTKTQLGLDKVENTADLAKSVKYAGEAYNAHELIDTSGNLLDVGSSTKPVYFNGGIPEECDRSLLALTNNLLATVAGTALDATQGKVLYDALTSFIDQINRDYYGTSGGAAIFDLMPEGTTGTALSRLGSCYVYSYEAAETYHAPSVGYAFAFGENIYRYGIIFIGRYYNEVWFRSDYTGWFKIDVDNLTALHTRMDKFSLENGRTVNAGDLVSDLNDIDFNCFVCATSITAESGYVANCPKEGTWFYIQTMRFVQNADYRKQIAYELWDNTKMWIRTCSGGTWGDWVEK